MLLLFYGDNHFAADQKISEAIARYLEKAGNDFGLERIDASEVDPANLRELLTSMPFLATSRLVILKDATQNKLVGDKLLEFIDDIPDTTNVIFNEPKPDKRTRLFKALLQKAQPAEFKIPEGRQLIGWVQQQARESGGEIGGNEAKHLIERVGSDPQRLKMELDKLVLSEDEVTNELIDSLIEPTLEESVFELTDAFSRGDTEHSMKIYRELRQNKSDPVYIINMIGWQLRNLAMVAAGEGRPAQAIASDMKLSPYVVRKTQPLAKKIGLENIKKAHTLLAETDVKSKSTKVDTDQLVEQMIWKIARLFS